jgi:hypothetical protein
MDLAPLATLERAELAAREQRLGAAAEADRIIAAATDRAAAIAAGVPDRIAAAVAELRRAYDERARHEIEQIERELAMLEATPQTTADPAFAAAVELVVRAVLGERERSGDRGQGVTPVTMEARGAR